MEKINQLLIPIGRKLMPKPTIIFTEEFDREEPMVFVANHEKNYGPSIMQLFFPLHYRPWIIHNMLEKDVCYHYIRTSFFEDRLNLPKPIASGMARLLEPGLIKLMHSTHPIPVYREEGNNRIVSTFRESMKALKAGDNLLIFPENQSIKPFSDRVKQFRTGFLFLAQLYYRKTGKCLRFCPVAINPQQHTICVGRPVAYQPEIAYEVEQERISLNLMRQIDALFEVPWARAIPEWQVSAEGKAL